MNRLIITEMRTDGEHKPSSTPLEGDRLPHNFRVWVQSEEDGTVLEVPLVAAVDLPLRPNMPPEATIKVLFPVVQLSGR